MKTIRKTVLFADDDLGLLALLRRRCEQIGLDVITVADAMTALNAARDDAPDLICVDVGLPGGNGLAVIEMLASDEGSSKIPRIVMTGRNDHSVQQRCDSLTAHYLLKTPNIWASLEPLLRQVLHLTPMLSPDADAATEITADPGVADPGVADPGVADPVASGSLASNGRDDARSLRTVMRTDAKRTDSHSFTGADAPANPMVGPSLLSQGESVEGILDAVFALMGDDESDSWDSSETPQPWVLCIDDDRDFSHILAHRLKRWGIGVANAFDAIEGVQKAFSQPPNAIILDINMPYQSGDYVLRRIRETPSTCDTAVIVLTGNKDDRVRRMMLDLGADAFLYKPPQFDVLIDELRRHIEVSGDGLEKTVLSGSEST